MIETSRHAPKIEMSRSYVTSQLSRFVFVGGSPRSGTTLVQRMLGCHPEIYGGPEFDFIPLIANLCRDMHHSIQVGRIDGILNEDDLVHAFRALIVALLAPKLEIEQVTFLSEKTPSNVLAFPWLDEYAPESKKILVIRDPRDVVSSMLAVGQRQRTRQGRAAGFTRDTVAAVEYMNQCLKAGLVVQETSSNCLIVHYEDVVSDPLTAANRMYRFIGAHELERVDLKSNRFEAASNQESWIDWSTPGTISGAIKTDRIGVAERKLRRSDWDYVCAKTIRHPLIANRYSLASSLTVHARWCLFRCLASRLKERMFVYPKVLLTQLKQAFAAPSIAE